MNKIIKIEIEIENEFSVGFRGTMNINDMLFTEYSRVLDYDILAERYKKAIKKLEGFSMLTITLTSYEQGKYKVADMDIFKSFRYTQKCGEVQKSNFNGYSYNHFVDDSIKNILPSIKEMVERGNKEFIELLKSNK
jgi:hypothetical protein